MEELNLTVTMTLNLTQGDEEVHERRPPLFLLASLNPATAPSVEVPWSQLLALSLSSDNEPPVLTVGRHKDCNVQLEDPRVSLRHFEIVAHKNYAEGAMASELGSITYECVLTDSSSNGTSINGKIVGKGQSGRLRSGDEIGVLPESKVGEEQKVAFLFRNTTEILTAPRGAAPEPASEDAILPEIKLAELVVCPICMLVIYKCVALTPCLHNFCSGCFSEWMKRKTDCPVCRQKVDVVIKNHAMDEVICALLEAYPEKRRTEEQITELDMLDQLQLGGSRLFKAITSGDGEGAVADEAAIPPRIAARVSEQTCAVQ